MEALVIGVVRLYRTQPGLERAVGGCPQQAEGLGRWAVVEAGARGEGY